MHAKRTHRLGTGLRARESLPELELLPESDSLPELLPLLLEPLLEALLALALRARAGRFADGDTSRGRLRLRNKRGWGWAHERGGSIKGRAIFFLVVPCSSSRTHSASRAAMRSSYSFCFCSRSCDGGEKKAIMKT